MTSSITIRRAEPDDADAALRLWAHLDAEQAGLDPTLSPVGDAGALWATEFHDLLRSDVACLLVAVVDDAVVGLITARLLEPPPLYEPELFAFVDELVVDPAARQRGIGRRLVEALRVWASEHGVTRIEARVVAGNSGALGFWARVGGQEVARTVRLGVLRA